MSSIFSLTPNVSFEDITFHAANERARSGITTHGPNFVYTPNGSRTEMRLGIGPFKYIANLDIIDFADRTTVIRYGMGERSGLHVGPEYDVRILSEGLEMIAGKLIRGVSPRELLLAMEASPNWLDMLEPSRPLIMRVDEAIRPQI